MGASAWHYVVGYRSDVRVALRELQETVLADGNYYHGLGDRLTFASMAELDAVRHTSESFWEEGTHSILDMMAAAGPDEADDFAVVRLLRDDEVRALFGHAQPTHGDFERFTGGPWEVNRWEGRATTLYKEGLPHLLAFWGISGD